MKIQEINNAIALALKLTGYVNDVLVGYLDIPQASFTAPQVLLNYTGEFAPGNTIVFTATSDLLSDMTILIDGEIVALLYNALALVYSYTIPAGTDFINISASATNSVGLSGEAYLNLEPGEVYAVQSISSQLPNYNPAFQYYLYNIAGIAANETYTTQDEADAVTTLTEPIFRRTEYLENPTSIPYTYFIGSDIDNKTRVDKIPFTSLAELDNFSNLTEIDDTIFAAYDGETSGDNKIWNGVQVQSYRFPDSLERINISGISVHQGQVSLKLGGNVRAYQNNTEASLYYLLMPFSNVFSHIEMSGDIDTTIGGVNQKMFVRDNVLYADAAMGSMAYRLIFAVKNNVDTDEFTPYLLPMSMLYFIGNGSSDDIYIKRTNVGVEFMGGILGYNNTIHLRNDVDIETTIGNLYGSDVNIMDYTNYIPISSNNSNIDINSLSQGTIVMSGMTLTNTTLNIPANLKGFKLENNANMPYLTSLTISPDNTYVSYSNGFLANYDDTITYFPTLVSDVSTMDVPEGVNTLPSNFMEGNTNLEELSLPSTLTYISSRSFYNCFNLADLTISEGTTELGSEAFTNADALTTLTLPSTLREIDYQALAGLNSLTELVIPEGVTTTESGAFMINTSLYTLDLPSTFSTLGYYSLESSDSLKNIILRNPTPPAMYRGIAIKYHINGHDSEGGARALSSYDLFVPDASVSAYQADSNWGQLNVRPLSEYVRTEPFYINLTIGSNKHFALDSNTQFVVNNTTLNIPYQLESMDVSNITFPNLTNVVIAQDNTHFTFMNGVLYCDGVEVLRIAPTVYAVQSFDSSEPNYNDILQMFLYEGGVVPTQDRTTMAEAAAVTELPAGLFMDATIRTCNELQYFTNLAAIRNNCFDNSYLEEIIIPASVTSIETYAFHGCGYNNYLTATVLATTPPTLGANAFDSTVTIKVPAESVSAYQSAAGWSSYNIVPIS